MRQHLFKGATLVVAVAFIVVAAVAAGGGRKKPAPNQQAVTPNAPKTVKPTAEADAGAGDAGADVKSIFGGSGPEYFPASKSPGGLFIRPSGSSPGGPGTKQPEPQPKHEAPQM